MTTIMRVSKQRHSTALLTCSALACVVTEVGEACQPEKVVHGCIWSGELHLIQSLSALGPFLHTSMAALQPEPSAPGARQRAPGLAKLARMIQLAASHRGTHYAVAAAAAIVLSYYTSRRAAQIALRRKAIEALLERSKPASRVQSALNLESMSLPQPSASTMPHSKSVSSLMQLGEGHVQQRCMPRRRPSEMALAELTGKVCEGCLSRCASHSSLSRLDEEEDAAMHAILQADDEATVAPSEGTATTIVGPGNTTPVAMRPMSSMTRERVCEPCQGEGCEICNEVTTTWVQVVRRALQLTLGTTLGKLSSPIARARAQCARAHELALA